MTLAEKISVLRKQRDISQEGLAAGLGVTLREVNKWETGESTPEVNTLVKLSEMLDVSLDYLLKDESASPVQETGSIRHEPVSQSSFSGSDFFSDSDDETERVGFQVNIRGAIWPFALLVFLVIGFFDIQPWGRAWLVFVIAWVIEEIVDWFRLGRFGISIYSIAGILFLGAGFFDIVSWSRAWLIFVAAWVIDELFIAPNKRARKKKKKKKHRDY